MGSFIYGNFAGTINSVESLRYWDVEKHFDLKWSIFQYYSIYKDYLVLFVGESLVDLLMFNEAESAKEKDEYHKIEAFVKTKLT